jgi:hypothetical protein
LRIILALFCQQRYCLVETEQNAGEKYWIGPATFAAADWNQIGIATTFYKWSQALGARIH